jgi:hypothetical protein
MDDLNVEALLAAGATADEVATEFVASATWLAKTTARAGDRGSSERLFAAAAATARSAAGSPALVARVHRERSGSYSERGRRLRARLEALRAARAERAAVAG